MFGMPMAGGGEPAEQVKALNMWFGPMVNSADAGSFTGPVSAYNLGQAYQGVNVFLKNTMYRLMHEKRTKFWTGVVLPTLLLTEHHVAVAYKVPSKAINGPVPYEGTARMMTQRFVQKMQSAHRRGVMAKFEGDYLKFAKDSKLELASRMEQMRWSVQETMNYLVASELSRAPCPYRERLVRSGRMQSLSAERILAMETQYFGAAQKGPMNLAAVVATAQEALMMIDGDEPDTVILPSEMQHRFDVSKAAPVLVPVVGPNNSIEMRDMGISAVQFGKLNIFFTESMVQEEGRPPFSPFMTASYTPQKYRMGDPWVGKPHDGWRACMMNTFVHSEQADDYVKVRIQTAVANCMRWKDADGDRLAPANDIHDDDRVMYNSQACGIAERCCGTRYRHDVLHAGGPAGWRVAQTFGEFCEYHHLPQKLLLDCARTMVTGIGKFGYAADEAERIVGELRGLVEDSDNNSTIGLQYYANLCKSNKGRFDADPADANAPLVLKKGAVMTIPSTGFIKVTDTEADAGGVPPGVCTWMALRALASHKGNVSSTWRKAGSVASECVKFVRAMASHVAQLVDKDTLDNVKVAWAPKWQRDLADDEDDVLRCALFNMLLGQPRPPVYVYMSDGRIPALDTRANLSSAMYPWAFTALALLPNVLSDYEVRTISGDSDALGDLAAKGGERDFTAPTLSQQIQDFLTKHAGRIPETASLPGFPAFGVSAEQTRNAVTDPHVLCTTVQQAMIGGTSNTCVFNIAARVIWAHRVALGVRITDDQAADLMRKVYKELADLYKANREMATFDAYFTTQYDADMVDALARHLFGIQTVAVNAALRTHAVGVSPEIARQLQSALAKDYSLSAMRIATAISDTQILVRNEPRMLWQNVAALPDDTVLTFFHLMDEEVPELVTNEDDILALKQWIYAAAVIEWRTTQTVDAVYPDINLEDIWNRIKSGSAEPRQGKWARTIFGLGRGLVDYIDETLRARMNVFVAPGDPATAWTTPLYQPLENQYQHMRETMRVRNRATLRTGARTTASGSYPSVIDGRRTTIGVMEPQALTGYGRDSLTDDLSGGPDATRRIKELHSKATPLTPLLRALATVLLMTRVTKTAIKNLLDADAMPPIAIDLLRPFIEHTMKGMWIGRAGYAYGATFYGQEDVKAGWDANRHVLTVNLTYHVMPFIWRPENAMVVRNVLDTERCRHYDVDFCTTKEDVRDHAHSCIARLCSYYDVVPEPCKENEDTHLPLLASAVGDFHIDGIIKRDETRAPHMSCDAVYNRIYPEFASAVSKTVPMFNNDQNSSFQPHLCFQGEQYIPDTPLTCHTVVHNAGPIGQTGSLPGSASVRSGGVPAFADQWFMREGLVP